jgi:hypothetical protein
MREATLLVLDHIDMACILSKKVILEIRKKLLYL